MTLTFYSRVILYGEIRCKSLFGKLEGNRDQNQHEIGIPKDVKSGLYLKAVTYQGEVWDCATERNTKETFFFHNCSEVESNTCR